MMAEQKKIPDGLFELYCTLNFFARGTRCVQCSQIYYNKWRMILLCLCVWRYNCVEDLRVLLCLAFAWKNFSIIYSSRNGAPEDLSKNSYLLLYNFFHSAPNTIYPNNNNCISALLFSFAAACYHLTNLFFAFMFSFFFWTQ